MNNKSDYMIQIVGDKEWYGIGLGDKGYMRRLHWYYYNDSCPAEEYINVANKWASDRKQT